MELQQSSNYLEEDLLNEWIHQLKLWHSGRIRGLLSLFSEKCANFLQSKFIHRWVSGLPIMPTFQEIFPIGDILWKIALFDRRRLKIPAKKKVSSQTKHCKVKNAVAAEE